MTIHQNINIEKTLDPGIIGRAEVREEEITEIAEIIEVIPIAETVEEMETEIAEDTAILKKDINIKITFEQPFSAQDQGFLF